MPISKFSTLPLHWALCGAVNYLYGYIGLCAHLADLKQGKARMHFKSDISLLHLDGKRKVNRTCKLWPKDIGRTVASIGFPGWELVGKLRFMAGRWCRVSAFRLAAKWRRRVEEEWPVSDFMAGSWWASNVSWLGDGVEYLSFRSLLSGEGEWRRARIN